jgi:hypothetical protein
VIKKAKGIPIATANTGQSVVNKSLTDPANVVNQSTGKVKTIYNLSTD